MTTSNTRPTIAAVRVSNVRGVADQIGIGFGVVPGSSLVLLGDNGAGKSSIADAIEFGLRGVVSRRSVGGAKQRRELQNVVAPRSAPRVEIEFTDGTAIARGAQDRTSVASHVGQDPVSGFELCPVVVRRRDIDGFWLVPDDSRREFFFDYLREPRGAFLDAQRREQVETEAALADDDLYNARLDLADLIDWEPNHWPDKLPAWRKLRPHLVHRGRKARVPRRRLEARLDELEELLIDRNRTAGYAASASEYDSTEEAQRLEKILRGITPRVSADFVTITSLPISQLIMRVDGVSGLTIRVKFSDGKARKPQDVLSEAQLDLFALLVLLEVHIECIEEGQRPLIVLDDVFQSVDRSLRARAIDHIADRLTGWQVVITVHDRLWSDVIRRSLSDAGHQVATGELRATAFGVSPTFIQPRWDLMSDVRAAISGNGSPALVVGAAGRALEAALEIGTQSMGTRVPRKDGDRYTINDLWEPVEADLKLCDSSGIAGIIDKVEAKRYIRNAIGAHYNESADTFTHLEAAEFVDVVQGMVDALFCGQCGRGRRKQSVGGGRWVFQPAMGCKHRV